MLQRAFTLIELLVVITIIVVLLALLTPALDRAIYQAELAVCAANLRAIATGAVTYAMDQRRSYPYRPGVRDDATWPVAMIYNGDPSTNAFFAAAGGGPTTNMEVYDDRPILRTFLGLNAALNDPMTGKLDFNNDAQVTIYSTVSLWFGYQFKGHRGMKRVGDRWSWSDTTGDWRFNVLASDRDTINAGDVQSTHPDKLGTMSNYVRQPGDTPGALKLVVSFWRTTAGRAPSDLNYALDDGSVRLYKDVAHLDSEMAHVPESNQGPNGWVATLPNQR